MKNLKRAAAKAIETLVAYGMTSTTADPLAVLLKLDNALPIPYEAMDSMGISCLDNDSFDSAQNAFTLVNKKNGKLQYIVLYNNSLEPQLLRLALAKELGHVVLKHDGNAPEYIWIEESSCFAHFFLFSPSYEPKIVNYRPVRATLSLELKEMVLLPLLLLIAIIP